MPKHRDQDGERLRRLSLVSPASCSSAAIHEERTAAGAGHTGRGTPTVAQQTASTEELLKCVWSHNGGCQARLPARVVAKSWQRESERSDIDEGFFHVPWRGGLWLAYGVRDSGVRGVYCPTHSAERAGHTSSIAPRRSSLAAGA